MSQPTEQVQPTEQAGPAAQPLHDAPTDVLARQAVGYWTGVTHRAVVQTTQTILAGVGLSQPAWWALSFLADSEHGMTREELADVLGSRLAATGRADELLRDALDDLLAQGWAAASGPEGRLVVTGEGEAVRSRAWQQVSGLRERMHAGVSDAEYAAAVRVLRRITHNLDGPAELPVVPSTGVVPRGARER